MAMTRRSVLQRLAAVPLLQIRGPQTSFVLRTASNTGLAGAGISEASLTNQGAITYGTNGQTITGKRLTGTVTVTGANVTISGCLFEFAPGSGVSMLRNESGSGGLTIVDCTFRCTSATSGANWCIMARQPKCTIRRCDVSGAENCLTTYADDILVEDSYLHFPSSADPAGHNDTIEVYGGTNCTIRNNTILLNPFTFTQAPTEPINVAPWSGSGNAGNVTNLTIQGNYIDGDYFAAILLDTTQSGSHSVTNVRIIRNRFGGHNRGGAYGSGVGAVRRRSSTSAAA